MSLAECWTEEGLGASSLETGLESQSISPHLFTFLHLSRNLSKKLKVAMLIF
jgi:hypothetical protein